MACDILIPAHNHPNLLRDVLSSLDRHTNRALLGHIWIGDDGSDAFSKEVFQDIVRSVDLPITLIRHEQPLGFGANCNALFACSTADHCILLNTDTLVPPRWLERMLAPFQSDPRIMLATPLSTNAAEHTVSLRAGQTWIQADRERQLRQALYPDASTAIGFCIGIDRKMLCEAGMPLFDPRYGRGYGEDTDLHFRVVEKGFRSVIVDNLLIHHLGGASFAALQDHKALQVRGRKLFLEQWGEAAAKAAQEFSVLVDNGLLQPSEATVQTDLDVLIVLPTTADRFGGVWIVCMLASFLIARGMRVGVYADHAPDDSSTRVFGFAPWRSLKDVQRDVASVGCVLATADSTLEQASMLAAFYHCPEALFLQGMEVSFRSGHNVQTYQWYKQIETVLCVSEALQRYIALINPKARTTLLSLGPDPLVFYPRTHAREPRTIAIALSGIPEKGSTKALEIGLLLRERGFALTFFGWDAHLFHIPPGIGTIIDRSDRDALAQLFSRTEFYLDHSFSEGLGLLPLEAAFCGCIPILTPHGGPEYIFSDNNNAIIFGGYKELRADLDRIARLSSTDRDRLRNNLDTLRTTYGLMTAFEKAENVLRSLSARSV